MTTITPRELQAMRAIVNYNLASEEADYENWQRDERGADTPLVDDPTDGHIIHELRILDNFLTYRGA